MAGIVLYLGGLILAASPFVVVEWLQRNILDEVPLPVGVVVVLEGLPDGAITDDDFVLAYRGVDSSVTEVEQTLRAAGFSDTGRLLEGSPTLGRECCGSFDGVFVSVFEGRDGITGLRYTVADDDLTATWPFITGIGAVSAFVGIALVAGRRRPSSESTAPDRRARIDASAI